MRLMSRLVALVLLVACVPTQASAGKASAKKLFREAERHYEEGRFLDALDSYHLAYKKRPLAGFYINIGQCYRQLMRWKKAIAAYEKYLALAPKGKHRSKALALIARCREKLKKRPKTEAVKPKPVSPPPRTKPPVAVAPVVSEPAVSPPAPSPVTPAAVASPEDQPPRGGGLSKIFFWSGVGLSAAFLAATAITGVMALGKSDEYKDPATPAPELQGLKDSGETLRTSSNIMLALGLASAVGTSVLFFFTDWRGAEVEESDSSDEDLTLGAAPIQGGAMLRVGGRF